MNIIQTLNNVRVVKNDEGRYGIEECINGEWAGNVKFRYSIEFAALKTAQAMSDENDSLDAYEASHQ